MAAGDTQTWELNPLHADDLKGLGDFEDGVTRDPTYQVRVQSATDESGHRA